MHGPNGRILFKQHLIKALLIYTCIDLPCHQRAPNFLQDNSRHNIFECCDIVRKMNKQTHRLSETVSELNIEQRGPFAYET